MQKKIIIISLLFLLASGILFTLSQLKLRQADTEEPSENPLTQEPLLRGENKGGPLFTEEALALQNKIKNLLEDGSIRTTEAALPGVKVVDVYPENLGISQVPDYQTTYNPATNEFQISLYLFPLADTRLRAQKYFLEKMSLTEKEACLLRVSVEVGPDVSQFLAGKNLGLTFCKERIDLSPYTKPTDSLGSSANQESPSDTSL